MSTGPLRLVDEHGQLVGEHKCEQCAALQDQVDGADREIKAWRARYAELKRDRDAAAKANGLWPVAISLFAVWKRSCGHSRAAWTTGRFELVEPILKARGEDFCLRAIAGAAFDAFETLRKNGTTQRHDGFDLVFRAVGKSEEFAARAPAFWRLLLAGLDAKRVPDGYLEVDGNTARLWCPGPLGARPCFASVVVRDGERADCRCGRSYVLERGEVWAARR